MTSRQSAVFRQVLFILCVQDTPDRPLDRHDVQVRELGFSEAS